MKKIGLMVILCCGFSCAASALKADFFPDRRIDLRDFAILAEYWTQSCPVPCDFDLNGSGAVGLYELSRMSDEWLLHCPWISAAASTAAAAYPSAYAADRNFTTRWVSAAAGTQWLQIDLETLRRVKGLQLYWHMACASEYKIYTSLDAVQWQLAHHAQNAQCGAHFVAFAARLAHYIRIECLAPFSSQMYSLHEVRVDTEDECTPDSDWTLAWSDEFDGPQISAANWSHQTGGGGWGNNELQYYTNSSANSYIENGCLVIKAKRETQPVGGRNYTSARLTSQAKQSFAYGKLEARIKIPSGMGIWPAFWMMPENSSAYDGGWPACGEIDIMEAINVTTRVHGTLHYGSRTPAYIHNQTGGTYTGPAGKTTFFGSDFHTYTIVWEPDRIRWYCDGTLFAAKLTSDWWTSYSTAPGAPFDKPFHFILNVAVGGNWPGFVIDEALFPHYMRIDWVRVYQKP